jgi:transposase-like protein
MELKAQVWDIFTEAVEAVEKYGSKSAAARALGLSRTTLLHRYQQGLLAKQQQGEKTDTAAEREVKRLRAELSGLNSRYKQALQEIDDAEARIEFCAPLGQSKPQLWKRVKTGRSEASTAILCLTDWHCEEQVDPETCGGKNEYNLEICARRAKNVFAKALELIDNWRHTWPIDELYVPLLGDFITGYIHEELVETNYLSPTEASLFVEQLLLDGLSFMLRESKVSRIIVPTCFGNHGRTTQKKRIKTGYKNSFEWLLYNHLARYFRNEPRVEFRITKGYHSWQEIQGRQCRLHHGDFIKYQGGIGGITIPVEKAIAAWNKTQRADYDFFGHWHQHLPAWRFVSCGCMIGYNDFSVAIKAEFQEPSQPLVLMSRKYGKVADWPVFVE